MADNKKPVDSLGPDKGRPGSHLQDAVPAGGHACDVRTATCFIDDRVAFLQKIRTIAESFDTHIICFNAGMLAGKRHAQVALHHAVRSFHNGSMVSDTVEMEALLFAAGSRQCSVAALFGIHEGDNSMFVCCYPTRDGVWDALAPLLSITDYEGDTIDPHKRAYLMELFGITKEEMATCSGNRIIELVLERIALLEVYR
ncbi:MAG: KEOPS complex subunit Cgi121 [Methanoregula sp.]|nr:KEOPS complex subunit Cgi121 [Methanoregula sp.]